MQIVCLSEQPTCALGLKGKSGLNLDKYFFFLIHIIFDELFC